MGLSYPAGKGRTRHPKEAGHTCREQQHGRGAAGLILARGQLCGVRAVGPDDDWPDAHEEGERGGVPAVHSGHPPRHESQKHDSDDQPDGAYDDGSAQRGRASPAIGGSASGSGRRSSLEWCQAWGRTAQYQATSRSGHLEPHKTPVRAPVAERSLLQLLISALTLVPGVQHYSRKTRGKPRLL